MPTTTKPAFSLLLFGGLIATLAWFALVVQYLLHTGPVINLFSYFTILSNLLVAVGLTALLLLPAYSKPRLLFARASVQTAIAVYIFVVGLVYNGVLRGIWAPTGWQLVVDNLLHVVVPVLYLLYWFFSVPKGAVQWRDGWYWLLFPLVYLVYSLIRGQRVNWYPYPFLNIGVLGYTNVFVNSSMVLVAFLAVGLGLIAINRFKKNN
ncbi:MAG: hypothetical protein EOO61_21960 [Hymenobacter sp.]|nr:MAG: hypothetical protein EOO61_21960 [Hymenobacter sp.]